MDKHSDDAIYRSETRQGDIRRLQLVLAGTVCLLTCFIVVNILVYVHLTAAIADLSHRVGVEKNEDTSIDPNWITVNAPDVETTKGLDSRQDNTRNQSLTHFPGLSRQNGQVRKRNARSTCGLYEYQCHNGRCIPSSWQCNDDYDCSDGSDEPPLNTRCAYPPYECENGYNIPSVFQCDGDFDCTDGSDEYPWNEKCKKDHCETHRCQNNATCLAKEHGYTCICPEGLHGVFCQNKRLTCSKYEYQCQNGRCIPSIWQCDYDDDCSDGSDEPPLNANCTHPPYRCKNGYKIPSVWLCDGDVDCTDGSDEYPWNEKCKLEEHCETHQCQNNATCRATEDGYTCICTDGWLGKYCQQKIDQCKPHQCQNNATCRATEDGYTCDCTNGWRGTFCQKRQRQRGVRQGKNYGLLSLLSVHIQARTDTTETAGSIPVTGNFTQWRDITETRFGLQYGQLMIKETGKYFIYSQVYFSGEKDDAVARYSIKKGGEVKLTCERPLTGVPPPLTCYTAGVLDLLRGDVLVLYVPKRSLIDTAEDATFWGAVKLSIDFPKEERPRKKKSKKGKT
ncbi:very low-density lipoprotein receptor-like [Branchiostoma lanceolatum]|uniref:very low-density lipoprotein receptor-like n=1 Tax=Branchiostoma lanceolatum TaxID=7740 RepID=UPI00345264E3